MPYLGTRKLYYLLKKTFDSQQIHIGRDGLFDLLREEGLLIATKKRYTKTTNSKHWMHKYPNLIEHMKVERPEQLWVADITYVAVAQAYCYVHLITDAYSKQIMGYYTSENLAATSTLKALEMALNKRQYKDQLTHHSDRGLQYCSGLYTKVLAQHNIAISMTESGSPYDNAIAERVNGILKQEFGLDHTFETIDEVSKQVKQSVDIYNYQRPHLSNSLLTPNQMHQQNFLKPKPWHKKTTRTFEGSYGFLPSLLY
jgi:transposase InsO family protein